MVDIVDSTTRSRMMSGIRGRNTKPELLVRKFLHTNGLRYRLHITSLPGKPDIVLTKYKLAIFVHGCFWHRHPNCKYSTTPAQNRERWQIKFQENLQRDQKQLKQLSNLGWKVVIIWECGVRTGEYDLSWLIEAIKRNDLPELVEWPLLTKR